MKLLANENFPRIAVEELRRLGHDVSWVRTEMPGSDDRTVLERAQAEERILVTQDKDFGELAFRFRLRGNSGIILFRLTTSSPEQAAKAIVAALSAQADWVGHFAVVEDWRIRLRPLPTHTDSDNSHA